MEDHRSSAIRRAPAPPRNVSGGINSSSVATAEDDADRGGNYKQRPVCRDEWLPMPPLHTKRRREEHHCRDYYYYYDEDAYRASKKKHTAAEQATRVSNNRTTRPTAHASSRSRAKEESYARGGAAPRREIKDRKDGAGGCRSQERAPMISGPCVPPPAALPDSLMAQDAPSAATARAREILLMREEARRELAKMVRTVEFNDPYISPMDALKP
uniref:Uncharacterized protein n=1 Tax=Oryza punctata TaxID=4537 RepID=A0A0E0LMM8_ORYPU